MIGSLLLPELKELILQRDFAQLREILSSFPPPDLAELLDDLEPADTAVSGGRRIAFGTPRRHLL